MAQKFEKLFRKMSPEARKRVGEKASAEYKELALSELREAQDLTQVELAKKLGIDQGAVSKIETPHRHVSEHTAERHRRRRRKAGTNRPLSARAGDAPIVFS